MIAMLCLTERNVKLNHQVSNLAFYGNFSGRVALHQVAFSLRQGRNL